jgi:adenine/guanine phosphoribosyltransferase-like PRPP-binding protein
MDRLAKLISCGNIHNFQPQCKQYEGIFNSPALALLQTGANDVVIARLAGHVAKQALHLFASRAADLGTDAIAGVPAGAVPIAGAKVE